jgi:hemin uptake protein HemP
MQFILIDFLSENRYHLPEMSNTFMQSDGHPLSDDKGTAGAHPQSRMKRWTSQELFAGGRELVILHAGSEYRLRLTSQGKLVLTK